MNRLRKLSLVLAFLLLFPALAACGRGPTPSPEQSGAAASDESLPTGEETTAPRDAVAYLVRALNTVDYNPCDADRLENPAFLSKLAAFSARLYAMCTPEKEENYLLSPISVWFALTILNAIGDEAVRGDIEELFNMTQEEISLAGALFLGLSDERYFPDGTRASCLNLTNSIWINCGTPANQTVLDRLAEELYCYAHEAPFADDNRTANQALRDFVREKTNGLIDRDFDLSPQTLFALVNTLYLKDVWRFDGETLPEKDGIFTSPSGCVNTSFLQGEYFAGEEAKTDVCRYFYTETAHGYRMILLIPQDGCPLAQVMTAENLTAVCATGSYEQDHGDGTVHRTRCIFPAFEIDCGTALEEVFLQYGCLKNAFSGYRSELTDQPLRVSRIIHRAVFRANQYGVEGAAVTIIANKATAALPPKNVVYHDFVADRPFGFLLTDASGAILFAGQVTTP